ncbi:MAG: hypothetical protein JNL74_24305, partial [Fibrobacteres bacterium]|nr:hypothetical protein [Fibrobacterota bacterium]
TMSAKYFELRPDIFAEHVPELVTELDSQCSFLRAEERSLPLLGADKKPLTFPLIYLSGHTSDNPPMGYHNQSDTIMSDEFIAALQKCGVNNLQCFPAEIHSETDKTIWKNYKAVNIVGLVSAVDLKHSKGKRVISRPGAKTPGFKLFNKLKIDSKKTGNALLFRLAESRTTVVISSLVVKQLLSIHSAEEWGIDLEEL